MAKIIKRKPTFIESIIPLIGMGFLLGVGYGIYQLRPEILLICAAIVAGIIGSRLGYSFKEMEQGIIEALAKAMPAMLILISVGTLIGSWLASGTIPLLIYYGMQLISPKMYLVTACIICSLVSICTGTSWGTVGTIGVALIGIARGLGIPPAPAAGAIVAGAYFGDKISPFSDTTNLAPAVARSNLFDHIKHMLWTTAPAWGLGLIVYYIVGRNYGNSNITSPQMTTILTTIEKNFNLNLVLLLPVAVIIYFAVTKKPTIPGIIISSFLASILAMVYQGKSLADVVLAMTVGHKSQTGVQVVDELLSRGGLQGMMGVTLIAFCAFSFGGIIQKTGMLGVILDRLLKVARTIGALVTANVISCITIAIMTGSSYLSILIPGELFAPAYQRRKLAAKNLSRILEDAGTVVVPLIPWSMAGVFMAGTLGVPTLKYIPWAVMCYAGFLVAILFGHTGLTMAPKIREDETIPGS
jgi:NhaC family Na+:H+ antiporter